ncbi:kinase-like domain-containing protein [Xylaria longipes]|nr:kinase-like domain-containing protein [Xylaria longipes]
MSGSLSVNLKEWELEAKLHDDKTTHFSGTPSEQVWKRDHALGRGGFGEVWKETWDETNGSNRSEKRPRVRAVKRIRKTDKATQELPNLIKLSTKRYYGRDHLQHFVEFFGWFQDQHNIYVSMEYIPNHDLQQHIQERHGNANGFDESEGAFIVMEITKALKFMHEKNVMHRDLKPANILIYKPAPHWKIKLADFGISKDIELAGAHTKAGTDGYMAPEVADTNRKIPYTSAVDIWSLGAVTFCIQTGKPPFQDTLAVGRYIDGKGTFPLDHLLRFTGKLVVFIMQLMDIVPTRRPSVDQVLQHAWVNTRGDVPQDQE